jgi:hypothetical protein
MGFRLSLDKFGDIGIDEMFLLQVSDELILINIIPLIPNELISRNVSQASAK